MERLKHWSIKTYLSAVRHLQIGAGLPDPFGVSVSMPRLECVLKGVKRTQAEDGVVSRERLPITPHLLLRLRKVWSPEGHLQDTKLIWAAATFCFFAFMQAGELTMPTSSEYDPDVHLCINDVAVDDLKSPSVLHITLKQLKADSFRQGVRLAAPGRPSAQWQPY